MSERKKERKQERKRRSRDREIDREPEGRGKKKKRIYIGECVITAKRACINVCTNYNFALHF